MRHYYDVKDMLVEYPLVSEDSPEWKKTCPFCGAFDEVHEIGDTYICHECFANWIEHDTETERQIQVLNLNHGKMPIFNEGKMPLVEHKFYDKFDFFAKVDFKTRTVHFFDEGGAENDKLVASF